MKALQKFIKDLTISEFSLVEQHIKAYFSTNVHDYKTLQLFRYIYTHKANNKLTDEVCCKELYGTKKFNSFYSLKSRLVSKIFEAFANDFSIQNKNSFEKEIRYSIRLRKKMMQFVLLNTLKGNSDLLNALLDSILVKSKEYEVYPVYIDALMFKKGLLDYSLNKENLLKYNKISQELKLSLINFSSFIEIFEAYSKARYLSIHNKDNRNLKNFLFHFIKANERKIAASNSGLSLYFFYLIKISYLEKIKKYTLASEYAEKLIQIICTKKSVYRKSRLASAYHYSSTITIYAAKYERAISYSEQALTLFSPHSINIIITKEYLFYASFYAKNYRVAKKYLSEIQNSKIEMDEFRKSKYVFWQVCLYFVQGHFVKALKILLQKQLLSKDKLGWDWQVRILTILCFIELNKKEEAANAVSALQKYFRRNNLTSEVATKRQKRIYIILLKICNSEFMLKRIKPELNKQLLLITKRNAWEPLSPELIPFNEWLKEKIRK